MSHGIDLIDMMLSQKRGLEQSSILISQIAECKQQLEKLNVELESSQTSLTKLERFSLSAVVHSLSGSKDNKRQAEQEAITALESKRAETQKSLQQLKTELSKTETLLSKIDYGEDQILALSQMRPVSQKDDRLKLAIDIAKNHIVIIKIDEAIVTAKSAIEKLEETADYLDAARNLGVTARMGSNVISAFAKHKKLDTAKQVATQAQTLISQFNRELGNLNMPKTGSISLGEFARIVDSFLNDLNTDIHIQTKINKASDQLFFYKQSIIQTIKELRSKQKQEVERSASLEQNWNIFRAED